MAEHPAGPPSEGYLRRVLADGAAPFRYRAAVTRLLGVVDDDAPLRVRLRPASGFGFGGPRAVPGWSEALQDGLERDVVVTGARPARAPDAGPRAQHPAPVPPGATGRAPSPGAGPVTTSPAPAGPHRPARDSAHRGLPGPPPAAAEHLPAPARDVAAPAPVPAGPAAIRHELRVPPPLPDAAVTPPPRGTRVEGGPRPGGSTPVAAPGRAPARTAGTPAPPDERVSPPAARPAGPVAADPTVPPQVAPPVAERPARRPAPVRPPAAQQSAPDPWTAEAWSLRPPAPPPSPRALPGAPAPASPAPTAPVPTAPVPTAPLPTAPVPAASAAKAPTLNPSRSGAPAHEGGVPAASPPPPVSPLVPVPPVPSVPPVPPVTVVVAPPAPATRAAFWERRYLGRLRTRTWR